MDQVKKGHSIKKEGGRTVFNAQGIAAWPQA